MGSLPNAGLMKGKGSSIVKQIVARVRAMKARVMVTALTVISAKIKRAIGGGRGAATKVDDEQQQAVVVVVGEEIGVHYSMDYSPTTVFDEEIANLLEDPNASASAIEIVKKSKADFNLEDEIDEVADLFISKFHRRIRLQKLLSFKRQQQQQMLEGSGCE